MNSFKFLIPLFALSIGCNHTVDSGHVGVATDWGTTESWTYHEGFHWIGFGTDVYDMTGQVQALDFVDEDHITVLSKDRLQMGMDLSVQYQLNRGTAPQVFRSFYDRENEVERYTNRVVEPASREAIRNVVSRLDALDAVQQRDHLGPRIRQAVRRSVADLLEDSGVPSYSIRIVGVQVRNITLPERLRESIARIQEAENQAMQRQQEIQVARQEAERNRIAAEGRARVSRINATRDAEVTRIRAEAESSANLLVSRSLTPAVLEARRIDAQRAILTNENTRTFLLGSGGNGQSMLLDLRGIGAAQ